MTDNHGYVLAPLPVAPVNETDMVLLPKGLNASPFNMCSDLAKLSSR
jgi:hypothetical protein